MESVLGRYRNLIILVGVLFLQVLGLATQVKRTNGGTESTENTRLIRVWVVGAVTPFERGLVWIQNSTGNLWHNYFYLRGVRAENRALKSQIEQMRLEQVRLSEDAAQARRLQTLLAFKEQFISRTVAAQVIGSSGSDLSRIIYIDKGKDDGLTRDMAVITADGIVGKVLQVYESPSVSQVLLISDQSSGVGAILEKTRLQGVLRGTPNGEIQLERVMSDEQVTAGETVLTSGGDQIFPKGLPVGTVSKVTNGKDLFLNIRIKPATDLSKLEEVLVLVEKQDRQAVAQEGGRVRAADILAERLPSVPDKPAVDPKAVGPKTAGTTTPGTTKAGTATAGTAKAGITAAGTAASPVKPAGSSLTPAAKNPPGAANAHAADAGGVAKPQGAANLAPKSNSSGTTASKPASSVINPVSTHPATENPASKPDDSGADTPPPNDPNRPH